MNKNIVMLAAAAAAYWLYRKRKVENSSSISAFINGADYNEIYSQSWWL